jgi:hypothetical protein
LTEAFSTATPVSAKESHALPYPFNRDCEPENLNWNDQKPLKSAKSHIELPSIDINGEVLDEG